MICCKTDGMLWWWQGEMKAFCEICNLHFVSDADLNRHNRYHHMSKYDGTAEERTFLSATAELTTTAHRHISLRPQQVNKWLISHQLIMYYIGCAEKLHNFYWVTTMKFHIIFLFFSCHLIWPPYHPGPRKPEPIPYTRACRAKRQRGVFNLCTCCVNT